MAVAATAVAPTAMAVPADTRPGLRRGARVKRAPSRALNAAPPTPMRRATDEESTGGPRRLPAPTAIRHAGHTPRSTTTANTRAAPIPIVATSTAKPGAGSTVPPSPAGQNTDSASAISAATTDAGD